MRVRSFIGFILYIVGLIIVHCTGSTHWLFARPSSATDTMNQASQTIRAPNVFPSESVKLHQYCAILAATEPFRKLCLGQIKRTLNPFRRVTNELFGKSLFVQGLEARKHNIPVDAALTRFEMRVQSIVGFYGLTVGEFNNLTQSISKDPSLKSKVLAQSYFYKIAADLQSNIRSSFSLPLLPTTDEQSTDKGRKIIPYGISDIPTNEREGGDIDDKSPLKRFAKALASIETERLKLREQIKIALKIENLPANMADPSKLPAFAEPIQQASIAFPRIATKIVADCGFIMEEFNELREQLSKDSTFRKNVMTEINKLQS